MVVQTAPAPRKKARRPSTPAPELPEAKRHASAWGTTVSGEYVLAYDRRRRMTVSRWIGAVLVFGLPVIAVGSGIWAALQYVRL